MKRAVDFDGTLAFYEKWEGPEVLGEPIIPMVERVKEWLDSGDEVVIFTARVYYDNNGKFNKEDAEISEKAIKAMCLELFGQELEVTCEKDPDIEEIWDDRAVRVQKNTGEIEVPELIKVSADMLQDMEW